MKRLFLLRHGEAGFSDGMDHERNLTTAGVEQLKRLSSKLSEEIDEIDLLLCSTANRTVQTADLIASKIPIHHKEFTREIYEGNLNVLINLLSNVPKSVNSCLLVGHNPIISLLLSHLAGLSYQNLSPGTFAQLEMVLDSWDLIGVDTFILKEINS